MGTKGREGGFSRTPRVRAVAVRGCAGRDGDYLFIKLLRVWSSFNLGLPI